MLILVWKESEQAETHIFYDTYFESFQIHQLTILYHFEHTNQGIHLIFLKNYDNFKHFLHPRNVMH